MENISNAWLNCWSWFILYHGQM